MNFKGYVLKSAIIYKEENTNITCMLLGNIKEWVKVYIKGVHDFPINTLIEVEGYRTTKHNEIYAYNIIGPQTDPI